MAQFDMTFKLLMFGDGGVGKTSLTQRYVTGVFVDSQRITIGVDFHIKELTLEGKRIKLQVWDFGGEERFRFLLPNYCRGASGGMFLYDITSLTSLTHLVDWMQIVRQNSGPVPILMVGAKADLANLRKVQHQEAIEMAKSHRLSGFAEVSAKTGENVEKTFETITRLMMKRAMTNPPAPPPPR
jgi:small GTP-binding protein